MCFVTSWKRDKDCVCVFREVTSQIFTRAVNHKGQIWHHKPLTVIGRDHREDKTLLAFSWVFLNPIPLYIPSSVGSLLFVSILWHEPFMLPPNSQRAPSPAFFITIVAHSAANYICLVNDYTTILSLYIIFYLTVHLLFMTYTICKCSNSFFYLLIRMINILWIHSFKNDLDC